MLRKILTTATFTILILTNRTPLFSQDAFLSQNQVYPAHPRILMLAGEEKSVRASIAQNPGLKKVHDAILESSLKTLTLPTLERVLVGRRLLDKSREALRRIFYLSYSYRMTGEEKFLIRAEQELLNVSAFSDWNPDHFLDVAEMTTAVAIGYDWLYDKLSASSRETIRKAILEKGIKPSYNSKYNWFLTASHNWNQVCNAGVTFGALAIYEDEPALAKEVIERAITTIKLPMGDYKPDGAYPEGYSYWEYGTSFNVLFLSAIEKAFGTDFNLATTEGFLQSAGFRQHMTGTTGLCYNWGDCRLGSDISPAMFWFANRTNNPSLLFVENQYLQSSDPSDYSGDRILPALLIWGAGIGTANITPPSKNMWVGQGLNPVALMRTSWTDPNAIYLGFKAGSASVNHAHMDIGSFIMESDGIRWASDFGMQEYNSIESKGIQLFGRTQDAERWKIFRLNNLVHNTITVDNQHQLVKGYAKIDKHSPNEQFMFAISDLSTVYENQLASLKRGVAIADKSVVLIQDEIVSSNKPATVRWTMLTTASVTINSDNSITLKKDGRKLTLRVDTDAKIQLKTWSTTPLTDYDEPNPGSTLTGFETVIPANKTTTLRVFLIPEGKEKKTRIKKKPLRDW